MFPEGLISQPQYPQQVGARHPVMGCDVPEYARKGAHFDRCVVLDNFVVLPVPLGGDLDRETGLAGHFVSQGPQRLDSF